MPALEYYRILGLSPGTAWSEVRRRYRALARQYHPDRNPDDPKAAAQFRQVVEAYEALQQANKARARAAAGNYRRPQFSEQEQFFEEYFGISRSGSPLKASAGPDFRYDLEIPFAAAIRGMATVLEVPHHLSCLHCRGTGLAAAGRHRRCPDCQGRGRRGGGPGLLRVGPPCGRCQGRGQIGVQACDHCHGRGYCLETRCYRLMIPPGIEDGARLRIAGQGGEGFHQGPPGNLEIVIHVAPHKFFTRVGNDLYCQVKVPFALAALGGMVRIPTLEGYQTLHLPRGTQSGRTFRFPGAGAPGGIGRPPGDQVMLVVVTTPEHLSARQQEILKELVRLDRKPEVRAGNE